MTLSSAPAPGKVPACCGLSWGSCAGSPRLAWVRPAEQLGSICNIRVALGPDTRHAACLSRTCCLGTQQTQLAVRTATHTSPVQTNKQAREPTVCWAVPGMEAWSTPPTLGIIKHRLDQEPKLFVAFEDRGNAKLLFRIMFLNV